MKQEFSRFEARASGSWHWLLLAAIVGSGLGAMPVQSTETDPIDALRAEVTALKSEYEARLALLEERLLELEAAQEKPAAEPSLEDIRAAAQETADAEPQIAEPPPEAPVVGRERNLNRLNPEISMTGIVLANSSNQEREEFTIEEFELDVQAALDPFSRTRLTLAFEGEEVEIEEGYVVYSSLPGGVELTGGKFRQRFGPLNRQHLHALPQSDYPLAIQTYFGEEGLAQTGLSLNWLLPKPWANANEIALEFTDGENEVAFGGEDFEDFALLGRLKNYWDLNEATYFEWGLSGVVGETAMGGDSRVWGTDFSYHWQPPGRAKYRELMWRAEVLVSQRDDELGVRQEAVGWYTYLEGLLRRNLYAGFRVDRVEDPLLPDQHQRGIVPYITWWQSEFVRLRGEYGYLEDDVTGQSENRFTLQLTWAAGPHKHATY